MQDIAERTYSVAPGYDLMDNLLLVLGHPRQLATIPQTHVLATCTQPDGGSFEVVLLFLGEMATIKIMFLPLFPILIHCHLEIAKAQARFRPPRYPPLIDGSALA